MTDQYYWADHYPLPTFGAGTRNGPKAFVRTGSLTFATVENCILTHKPHQPIGEMDILDFGCGVGRVAIPFFHKYGRPNACVDTDNESIAYLHTVLPGAKPQVGPTDPPLPFADASFDVVYAISVWTHLPPDRGLAWLAEMRRILRSGGLAILTSASYPALKAHRETDRPHIRKAWADVSDETLRREGAIFRPNKKQNYGLTCLTAEWISAEWAKIMPVVEIMPGANRDRQDINVLRKT